MEGLKNIRSYTEPGVGVGGLRLCVSIAKDQQIRNRQRDKK